MISDTHLPRGSRRLPDECVQHCTSADAILHAGDVMELEVLEAIQSFGPPVYAVRGNVDGWELLARLPLMRTVKLDGVRIGMVHDAGPATGRAPEIAGPQERRMADLVRRLGRARGSRRMVLELPALGGAATAAAQGALLPTGSGPRGTETFEQWLIRTNGRPLPAGQEQAVGEAS